MIGGLVGFAILLGTPIFFTGFLNASFGIDFVPALIISILIDGVFVYIGIARAKQDGEWMRDEKYERDKRYNESLTAWYERNKDEPGEAGRICRETYKEFLRPLKHK